MRASAHVVVHVVVKDKAEAVARELVRLGQASTLRLKR